MKCTNCGFDAENNSVCPVCGNKLAEEPAPNNQNIPQNSVNPQQNPYYNLNYNSAQVCPPQQNPAPQNSFYPQPVPPQQPANPYIQSPQPGQPPYGAKPYPDYEQNTAPKKKSSNAGIIVLLVIVATVVITGIVLASLSGVMSALLPQKSEADIAGAVEEESDLYDYDYPEDKLDISAQALNKVGTPVELKTGGTVTLSKVEKVQTNTLDETKAQYAVTIEIKNTTDSDIQSPDLMLDYFGEDGQNLIYSSDNDVEFLYDETTDNYLDTIKKGETATRVEYIKASTSLGKMYILLTDYDYSALSSVQQQEICYEVELK